MATVLRSFRALPISRIAAGSVAAARRTAFTPVKAFSTSAIRSASSQPPQLLGPGAKPGTIPSDEEQATGLERFELLGKLEGVDVFDLKALEMTRLGTLEDPVPIYSLHPERQVGCTGFPADSHDTIWMTINKTMKNHRCPECGCVYTLNFQGDPHLLEHGHGHHH